MNVVDFASRVPALTASGYSWRSPGSPLLSTLVNMLLARGHRVSVFTLDDALEETAEPWLAFAHGALSVFVVPRRRRAWRPSHGRLGRMLDLFARERAGLAAAIKHADPQIVHAHWTYEYASAALASRLPTLVTAHDAPWAILRNMPDLYRLLRLLMAWQVLRATDFATVVSPYLLPAIAGLTSAELRVIPNPMPPWLFELNDSSHKRLPAAGEPLRIAMLLNGWTGRKNPKPAIRAMAEVRRRLPTAEMHLFGPGFEPDGPAARWAIGNRQTTALVFHGVLPHKAAMKTLHGMHLLLHPAIEESFGLTVAEAMTLGLPVVAGNASGAVPWVHGHGISGRLVDVRDSGAIAQAVIGLLSTPAEYEQCSRAALLRANRIFGAESVACGYERCYRDILNGAYTADSNLALDEA